MGNKPVVKVANMESSSLVSMKSETDVRTKKAVNFDLKPGSKMQRWYSTDQVIMRPNVDKGRSRDPRRRATVGYSQHNRSMDYEGTLSEVDGPTFHRGGFVRSSLPAARSPPTLDKPPGLVFLIFRDETKKALLPNEITHLDTVRAMFVRSFPGKLTMSYLESPKRKIYILEARTNIYYQLEDLRDIKDRTVLRVHECDSKEPQRVTEKPEVRGRTVQIPAPIPSAAQGYYGTHPSSAVTSQVHKAQTLPAYMHLPVYMSHDDITQSPARTAYERSRSLTPDPTRGTSYAQNPIYGRMGISPERPPPPQEHVGPPDRPLGLRTIPENYLMLNGYKNGGHVGLYDYMDGGQLPHRPHPRQAMSPPAVPSGPRIEPGRRAFSPPPNLQNYDYIQVIPGSHGTAPIPQEPHYVAKGVRATTVVTPQRPPGSTVSAPGTPSVPLTVQPGHQQSWRERSPVGRHSMALSTAPFTPSSVQQQRSQSYRVPSTSERDPGLLRPRSMTPSPMDNYEVDLTRNRIDKMEHQLANLAAWFQSTMVQTGSTGEPSSGKSTGTPASLTSEPSPQGPGLPATIPASDLGTVISPVGMSTDMKMNILSIKHQADALRSDLHSLRRLQQINKESILETVDDAWKKIKDALSSVPGAENLLIRQQRNEVDIMYKIYLEDKAQADRELGELEHAVEELRSDVLSRQCRVKMSDVEGMALVLSHVTKQLGELKARFPKLQESLKHVMSAEMELIVKEERFLKDEPERLDNSLKKCKKLTGTLFTLKRLASVQEHRPPQPVSISARARIPTMEDKKAVLENIQAMIPDHEARLQGIQAAENARMIKKKIVTQQESLRFGKSLELASKALRPQGAGTTEGAAFTTYPQSLCTASTLEMSSVISFAMPMSTSTPKSAGQPPTSLKQESSATSPSMSYPVMSLIHHVDPKSDPRPDHQHRDDQRAKVHEKGQGHKYERPGSGQGQSGEPAVLPVSSSETSSSQKKGDRKLTKDTEKPKSVDLSTQKSAARAAFFSSLSSPSTPTSSSSPPITAGTTLSIDSPTESSAKVSPASGSSPMRGIPTLVRSSAVSMPCSSMSTAVTQPMITTCSSISYVCKPSSLPVSGTSVVSSQKFSPASPANTGTTTSSSRPRTTFTAIPKPYSPTKSTPSPLTPESPKYRIPPSLQASSGIPSTMHTSDSRKAGTSSQGGKDQVVRPKKVPPPPPPRKSSKLPGQAVLAVNTATVNGNLPKPTGKFSESHISKPSVTFDTSAKAPSDIIKPPKQFANLELETKVERKSSIGSLKQFTTPLLESKRDKKELKDSKTEVVGKKVSASNLDTKDKGSKTVEKEIDLTQSDLSEQTVTETPRKIIDGKVTNISDDKDIKHDRTDSLDSTSSSSSFDSQKEIWIKRKDEVSEACESDTVSQPSSAEASEISSASALSKTTDTSLPSSSKSSEDSAQGNGRKKPKPPPPERRSSLSSKSKTDEAGELVEKESSTGKASTSGSIDRLV